MLRKKVSIWVVLCGFLMNNAFAGEAWRWKVNGLWVYSDSYPSDVKNPERVGSTTPNTVSSAATESDILNSKASKDFPVVLYGLSCAGCVEAKKILDGRKIKYESKDPSVVDVYKEFKLLSPQSMAPVIKIGSKVLIGFENEGLNSALDDAGYSKNTMRSSDNH